MKRFRGGVASDYPGLDHPMKISSSVFLLLAAFAASPSLAQKLGVGSTMIDGNQTLDRCSVSLGTLAIVEQKQDVQNALPPQLQALMLMANQNAQAKVDPLPLMKLLVNQSGCFTLVERGEAMEALQRERALAGASAVPALQPATYLLSAQVVYQDGKAGGMGGGLGGFASGIGGLAGLKVNKMETQVVLTLVEVESGHQRAVTTGSARKKDVNILAGGLAGAAGGALMPYQSTDMGKLTAAAILDAYRKLLPTLHAMQPATATPPAAAAAPALTPVPAPAAAEQPSGN